MADSVVVSSDNHAKDGKLWNEELNSLLSSSSSFSVATYLNLALRSNYGSSSSSLPGGNQPEEIQRRMAELALQLQIQTQSCHEGVFPS